MTKVSRDHRKEHDIAVIEHSSEDECRHIEASGLCLVNRGFTLPWLHTPQTPHPVDHKVYVIPNDSSHIYNENSEYHWKKRTHTITTCDR